MVPKQIYGEHYGEYAYCEGVNWFSRNLDPDLSFGILDNLITKNVKT